MRKWNRADKLLMAVAVVFAGCLALHLAYPGALLVKALFFCAEAALVGGIADWFAVTALFEKPLGFSYHTAIIPRRREKLIAACVKMVETEFFTKKKLIGMLKQCNLLDWLLKVAAAYKLEERATGYLLDCAERKLDSLDTYALALKFENKAREQLLTLPPEQLHGWLVAWLADGRRAELVVDAALAQVKAILTADGVTEKIAAYLESYIGEKAQGLLSGMLALLAESSNLLNYGEAAGILQRRLLEYVDNLRTEGHEQRNQLLDRLTEIGYGLREDQVWLGLLAKWQRGLVGNLAVADTAEVFLRDVCNSLKRPAPVEEGKIAAGQTVLADWIGSEMRKLMACLQADAELRQFLQEYLFEFAGRSLLKAQTMIEEVVREALDKLDDDALNQLIYGRVEQDLIWIRMNGSIVGAIVGLFIFVFLQCIGS